MADELLTRPHDHALVQRAFDHMAEHLLRQAKPATNTDGACVLLDKATGHRCAVGCFIDKKYYFGNLELGSNILRPEMMTGDMTNSPALLNALKCSGWDAYEHPELLVVWYEGQAIHDGGAATEWLRSLKILAEDLDLEWKF